ncbi:scoloptoxin SSD14-like isoform X2 [Leptopilina heterotoma]|uniref:scoloptoxin SSD14-like isoform X2 n=1 Tax=Leptopilina heterotoma TaxID=63436 RepID=UPI001CA8BACB|nr:scoloptoxin SSD14-like isoform X2 [Leptopilina heterotoma]
MMLTFSSGLIIIIIFNLKWKKIFLTSLVVFTIILIPTIVGVFNTNQDEKLIPPDPEYSQPPSWSVLRKFKKAAVCADGPPCALIGKTILEKNGSAVDATLAAMICNGFINMHSLGFGGGFFMTIYERKSEKAFVLDARYSAPAAAHKFMFHDKSDNASKTGSLSVAVPGELAGYWEAHKRFGNLPWAELFEPSIEICDNGYNLTKSQYKGLQEDNFNIHDDPTLKEMFIDPETGELRKPGSIIKPKKLCETMRLIAKEGVNIFYNGSLGLKLVEDLKQRGGIIEMKDLNDYRVKWREPASTILSNGIKVYSSGVPGGGDILIFLLNIFDNFHFTKESIADINSSIVTFQNMIEAFKYAYAFRTKLGDSDFVDLTQLIRKLQSKEFAKLHWEKINSERTWNDPFYYGFEDSGNFNDHGTSHISVFAPNGDAVSITSTVNLYFGSGIVSEQTGILLNSGMDDFGLESKFSYFGIPPSQSNLIEPGKRPLSSMSPTILIDSNNNVKMIIGAAGGTKITTAIAFVIARFLWMGNTLKEAVDAARIHHQLFPMKLIYEYGIEKLIIEGLKKLGHHTMRYKNHASIISAITRENETIFANADYRKSGDVYGID